MTDFLLLLLSLFAGAFVLVLACAAVYYYAYVLLYRRDLRRACRDWKQQSSQSHSEKT